MLRKIYEELKQIKKELHAIRSNMESAEKPLSINEINHQLGELLIERER